MNSWFLKVVRLCCLIALILEPRVGLAEKQNYQIENLDWKSKEKNFQSIQIMHQFGDLRLIQSNSDQVKIRSVGQSFGESPRKASLQTAVKDGVLNISLLFDNHAKLDEVGKDRIDSAVFLPPNVPVIIEQENGKLMTKPLNNDLNVKSFDSDFEVNSTGRLQLYSQNGNVVVKLKGDVSDQSKIKTSKGMLVINYDWAEAKFKINSHGVITTNDLTLLKSKKGKMPKFELTYDTGEAVVELMRDSGNIQLINLNEKEEY